MYVGDPSEVAVRRQLAAADRASIPPTAVAAIDGCAAGRCPWPLYLWGPPGGGKTMAALAVLRVTGGWFLSAGWWERCRIEDKPEAAYLLGQVERPRLVVVDEIGLRAKATDWQVESLKLLLDGRLGCPLVVTGNVAPEAVADVYDGRIADRLLFAGSVCEVDAPSRRNWRAG